ncbi:hypothetical protein ACP70R_043378 [Stipagrostis hirtigluma subsp. patula]
MALVGVALPPATSVSSAAALPAAPLRRDRLLGDLVDSEMAALLFGPPVVIAGLVAHRRDPAQLFHPRALQHQDQAQAKKQAGVADRTCPGTCRTRAPRR